MLSRQTQAALDLLHVADLSPLDHLRQWLPGQAQDMPQRVLEAAQAQVQALADLLRQRHGVAANTHVRTGAVTNELVRIVKELQADLLQNPHVAQIRLDLPGAEERARFL